MPAWIKEIALAPICFVFYVGATFAQTSNPTINAASLSNEISSMVFSETEELPYRVAIPELALNQVRAGLIKESKETYEKYLTWIKHNPERHQGDTSILISTGSKMALGFARRGNRNQAKEMLLSVLQLFKRTFSFSDDDAMHTTPPWPDRDFLETAIRVGQENLAEELYDYTTEIIRTQTKEDWEKSYSQLRLLEQKFKVQFEMGRMKAAERMVQLSTKVRELGTLNWSAELAYMHAALGNPTEAIKYLKEANSIRARFTKTKEGENSKPIYRFYDVRDQAIVARHLWNAGFSKKAEELLAKAIRGMKTTPYDDVVYYQRQIIIAVTAMGKSHIVDSVLDAGYEDNPLSWSHLESYRRTLQLLIQENHRNLAKNLARTNSGKAILAEVKARIGDYEGAIKTAKTITHKGCPDVPQSTRAVAFAVAKTSSVNSGKRWAGQCITQIGKIYGLLGLMDFYIDELPQNKELILH